MLIEVGGRKFKLNWRHEIFRTAADEWLAKYAPELDDDARMSLKAAMHMVPVRKRRGYTTCVIEEIDGDIKIEKRVECSRSEKGYRKERGRVESLECVLERLAFLIGPGQQECTEDAVKASLKADKVIRSEVFKQYHARKPKKDGTTLTVGTHAIMPGDHLEVKSAV